MRLSKGPRDRLPRKGALIGANAAEGKPDTLRGVRSGETSGQRAL